MDIRRFVTDLAFKGGNALHHLILALSGGRALTTLFGMPTVELQTIGRKTGARRSNILTAPLHDEHRVVLVASKGGNDRDPDWYLNLRANPDVELTVDGVTRRMVARTASEQEKAELWPQITATYGGYASYQRRTSRPIPVVICEPRL